MDCMYCDKNSVQREELMTEVASLEATTLYLHREGSYPGRCVLVNKRHVHKVTDLTEAEYRAFFEDVRVAACLITELFHPDKINYFIMGDESPHLHIHLVPKYKGGADWGGMFHMLMDPPRFMEQSEIEEKVALLRAGLAERKRNT